MNKNEIGKVAGISGAIAVLVSILCQVFHTGGVP